MYKRNVGSCESKMTSTVFLSLLLGSGFPLALAVVGSEDGSNGGACLSDNICFDDNAVCSQEAICICREGYVDVNGTCMIPAGNNGGACLPENVCNDVNAICNQESLCICRSGYVNVTGICRIQDGSNGGACLSDNQCTDANAVCSQDFLCNCNQGYIIVAGTCRKAAGDLGSGCEVNVDCVDPNSFCFRQTCQCSAGYTNVENTCMLLEADSTTPPVVTTDPPLSCPITCENGGTCILDMAKNHRCDCPTGFAGPFCQFDDLCLSDPCPTDVECQINDVGERICLCPPNVQDPDCTGDGVTTTTPTTMPYTTTPSTTTPHIPTCDIKCQGGGSCVFDEGIQNFRCECPPGLTGPYCENNVDYCANFPCPDGATCLPEPSSTLGYVCACQGDFKGPNCTEVDNLVVCNDFEKILYLEQQPTQEDRTICVPKIDSTSADICYDEAEALIYHTSFMDDTLIRIDEDDGQFCAIYFADDSAAPKYCAKLTAIEADDVEIRPWRKANATVCFVFNRKPEFVEPLEIRYNLPDMAESEARDLVATDPDDHQQLYFEIKDVSPKDYTYLFKLSASGLLETQKPVALAQDPTDIDVLVKVKDDGIPVLDVERIVKVKFTNRELLCDVNEDPIYVHSNITLLPKEIGRVTCAVAEDASIVFSMQGDGDLSTFFSVDQGGALQLEQYLQAETYVINVLAQLVAGPVPISTQVPVTVIIGNMLPDCASDIIPFTMNENASTGQCWNTTKVCPNPSGKPITCTDSGAGSGSDIFDLDCIPTNDASSIKFRLCSVVPLKNKVGIYELTAVLSNVYGETAVQLEAVIENVNDRPMIDKSVRYDFSVKEDYPVNGNPIATITVSDPDQQVNIKPPEELTVAITALPSVEGSGMNLEGNPETYPFAASLSQNQDYIEITLTEQLDVTIVRRYVFTVEVTDKGGLTDSVRVSVNVTDVNEKPFCEQYVYNDITVSVKDRINKVLVTLNCTDRDINPEFKNIVYEIKGDQIIKDHFAVDLTGEVRLIKPVTDITDSTLTITVSVSDGLLFSHNDVRITVLISSDFPPECSSPVITDSQSEATGAGVCFTVDSGCLEPVNSLPLLFEFDSGNGTQLFSFNADQQANNNIRLCTRESLRNKYGTWVLNGRAVSDFGTTPLTVIISVSDINDPPSFEKNPYRVPVQENTPPGLSLVQVVATDPDSGAFGVVTYMSDGDAGLESSRLFSLSKKDGWVFLTGSLDADIEGPTVYNFTVKAVDGGLPHDPVITTQVIIEVTDVNDNKPECVQPKAAIPLYLLTPVNDVVYRLTCSDADRSPEFRQLTYELGGADAEIFSVNAIGEIRLEKELSRDVQRHEVRVIVHDSAVLSTANTFTMDLTFAVNKTVPATCTPAIVTTTLQETKPENFCLLQVECEDITGGNVSIISAGGNGTKFLDIRISARENKLFLSACIVASIKDRFGIYQIEGVVTNGLAETNVIWRFTIVNVNEPPSFTEELYEETILETIKPGGEAIISLMVTDPDEKTPETQFHVSSVTAQSLNDDDFNGALSDNIRYYENLRQFLVVVGGLNATERNEYKYKVTVEDGMGLRSTSEVQIHIKDVNEEPICTDSKVDVSTDILEEVETTIGKVTCFDTDFDPKNKELAYSIISGDQDRYFNMTSDGYIAIAKALPRLPLYKKGRADIVILVEDNGSPPLNTTVKASILVDNLIKPTCNPVLTPPDIWYLGRCLNVTMYCSDPTIPGSIAHLAYSLSGNYTAGFIASTIIRETFQLCYDLTESGYFEIIIRVDNSLSVYQFSETVQVKYLEATPVFTESNYKQTVSEFTTKGAEILTVEASASNSVGDLVYSIIDAESTDGWSDFFSLNPKSGTITAIKDLKELADTIVQLRTQVQDTGSKLKSTALVEITIEDINEVPECDITETVIKVDVDTEIETVITEFSCTDPDVVAEYKELSYTITGSTNVNIYFKLVQENGVTSIALKTPLSVSESSYDRLVDQSSSAYLVTVEVRDSGNPPKVYSKKLNIIVSLLPPAVKWQILELGYSHVFISWEYERNDYYQVTSSFQVRLKKANGNVFVDTEVLKPDKRFYNTTGLEPNTKYELSVSADTPYGTRISLAQIITTAEVPKITSIIAAIKFIDLEYNVLLRDPQSDLSIQRTKEVTNGIDFVLKDSPGYVGTAIESFRPGSLIVTAVVSVNQSGNAENTRKLLEDSVKSGYLGQLAVDRAYFVANVGGGYVMVDNIQLDSEEVYSGTDLIITCSITTAGYELKTNFRFWWTFNGNTIRPNSASRISTVSYSGEVFEEIYISILEIRAVTPRDSGLYMCYVSDSDEASSSSKSIDVNIISQPVVTLSPRSLTVDSGSAVTMVCTLVEPLDEIESFQFLWYRNDLVLQIQQGEEYNENSTTGILSLSSLAVTTVFGCRGRNVAGEGPLVKSHIGVIPRGPTISLCSNLTDSRGTVWTESLPGTIAVAPCPVGYTGEITRECGENGKWKPPWYNCVQNPVANIRQQVKDIKDGSGNATIKDSLKGLDDATDNETLFEGDLTAIVDALDDTATASNYTYDRQETETEKLEEIEVMKKRAPEEDYLKVCSNLIDERNKETWDATIELEGYGANEVTGVVEKYIKTKSDQLSAQISEPFTRHFNQKNIYAKIGKETGKAISFPDNSNNTPAWIESGTTVYVPEETLKGQSNVLYDGAFFRNLSSIVVKKLKQNGNIEDASTLVFNSEMVGFTVQGLIVVDPPVVITFKLKDTNVSKPVCVFWDNEDKAWSTEGCYLDDFSVEDRVICKCNHFTNFAVLMSPGKAPPADILALSIISAVGCAISMFCLLVTVITHVVLWRVVKSDRAIILLNLCIALIIGYALFLGGVSQADQKNLCTAIAVLLHYIFLVVFFLMLAEGVEIAITILYVFATKSRIKWLIPLAWFIPAVIVAISLGVTKTEGYGNDTFCWLSTESGLLWAFVGPAAFIILVNFIIIIIVFRQMFTSSAMLTKSDKQKAKTSLRSLCVLLPIMGLTWIFGVFSVNEDLVAFQYIFAIFNSLQGFFIFLFHCLLNKQLRDAYRARKARKKSLESFEKSYKQQQHSTGTGSTAYQSSIDKTKEVNNDTGLKSSSSNPFLEADRQMKELVNKGKKTGNTFDKEADNRNKVDKDKPPSGGVALEDVKISNILRESEVMGGTAGISSILTTQPDAERRPRDDERQEEDKNKLRESKASSHAYDYVLDSSYKTSEGLQKPAGYEKLLPPQTRAAGYGRIVRSDDNMTGLYGSGKDSGSRGRDITDSRERIDDGRERSVSSSRSDEDHEARMRERQERTNTVYMPYDRSPYGSQDVSSSLPKKYDPKQAKKVDPPKKPMFSGKPKAEAGAVKKLSNKKKKEMEKDRSRVYQYQYPYDATYLGQQARHSSLENMSAHYVNPEYNPYAGMHPQGYTGRPTHQTQQWNPYGWGNQQRRDYW